MPDYPDWQRAYRLVGVDVTVPISIDAVTVTLNVDIVAQTLGDISVNLAASAVTLNVNLSSSSITLNVNLSSQTANIDISFEDQSVAVFDAAKWFAHNAQQIYIYSNAALPSTADTNIVSRTVPAGKTFFIVGFSLRHSSSTLPTALCFYLVIAGVAVAPLGSQYGAAVILDVPARATAGQLVTLTGHRDGGAGTTTVDGAIWGYDE